jgi:hypothetical protein
VLSVGYVTLVKIGLQNGRVLTITECGGLKMDQLGRIIPGTPQMIKLEPQSKEERRQFALLQAAATIYGSLMIAVPAEQRQEWDGKDCVADAKELLAVIEGQSEE